jgi:glucokinase-like ROK family protein
VSTIFWTLPNQNIKNLNKHAIVDLIRFTPGGIARVDLARELGLTRAAITSIIDDLQSINLVREIESQHPGGRRPIVLEINPDLGWVVGIDIGARHVRLVLADFSARVVLELDVPLDISRGVEACLPLVDFAYKKLLEDAHLAPEKILAVGVGVPGPVVQKKGMVSGPPIMPGWDGFPIRDHLESLWGCPVSLSNDAELGALGEWAYGAGRGERNLAYIKVGTGIGSGLLLDGQIYRGATGSAGEIGHITLDEDGPLCTCGNKGCLEALAGGWALARYAIESVRKGTRTQLSDIKPIESISAADVICAAQSGDLLAQQIVINAGAHLGTAIASLVNLFNPSMVVVGGSVSQMGDLLLDPIRRTVQQRSLLVASKAVRITGALLGRRSSVMGASVEALSIILHQLAENNASR